MKQKIQKIVIETLQDIVDELEVQNSETFASETIIFGKQGLLDSINLVALISDLEEKLYDEFGLDITIADERAMSQSRSPFATVSSLSEYIATLLSEESQ